MFNNWLWDSGFDKAHHFFGEVGFFKTSVKSEES